MSGWKSERSVGLAILLAIAIVAFRAPQFLSLGNFADLFLSNVPVLIVSLGMTLVMLCGEIDISVGSVFAVVSVVSGVCAQSGMPMLLVTILACALGLVIGWLNGALVSFAGIPSVIVTLAGLVGWGAALRWWTQGAWVQNLPVSFQWFGASHDAYVVLSFAVAASLVLFMAWVLAFTAAGRAIYATGSDMEGSRLAGIPARTVKAWAFATLGTLTGLAAIWNAVRFQQIPSNTGLGLELKVIAAVAVGGTAVRGGSGTVAGTALGVILLGLISPALTFLGVNAYWEKAIQGVIILAAVAGSAHQTGRDKRKAHA